MENEKPKKISDYLKMMCCITAAGEVVDKAMDTALNNNFDKVCPYCKRRMHKTAYDIHVCRKKVIAERLGK